MRLSIALMGHPKRQRFIDELVPQLPGVEVVLDRLNDRWDTGRRSMLAFDPAADYHLVVQDDALLSPEFVPGVEKALSHVPGAPVSFYTGRVRPYAESISRAVSQAQAAGKPWLAMRGPHWGVAIAVPVGTIKEMIAWCDYRTTVPNYDRRLESFFTERGILCWHSVPSLVDHRVGEENPSLVPGRGSAPSRTAHGWIGGASPLDIDWSLGPFMAPGCPQSDVSRFSRRGASLLHIADRDIYTGTGSNRMLVARAGQRVPKWFANRLKEGS